MPQGGPGAAERPVRLAVPGGESLQAGVRRFTGARVVSRLQKSVRSIFPIQASQDRKVAVKRGPGSTTRRLSPY